MNQKEVGKKFAELAEKVNTIHTELQELEPEHEDSVLGHWERLQFEELFDQLEFLRSELAELAVGFGVRSPHYDPPDEEVP
jgi:hypothetical protein